MVSYLTAMQGNTVTAMVITGIIAGTVIITTDGAASKMEARRYMMIL